MKLGAFSVSLAVSDLGVDSGPGSFVVVDPDGNPVLIDQHV